MDEKRAREIVDSLGVIEVMHNGKPVWIENITGNEAQITYIEGNETVDVSLNQLVEGDPIE